MTIVFFFLVVCLAAHVTNGYKFLNCIRAVFSCIKLCRLHRMGGLVYNKS